uniref:C-type lectin domain-containing protein n=1 Tax=Meloidogyne javanica TaxID=6303 RepID=A0A915N8F3_MELJA
MNFYEADVFCRARCAEVVSIHSQEEQNFVRRIAAPVLNRCQFTSACTPVVQSTNATFDRQLRSFWIGLNRVTGTLKDAHSVDSSVYQLWSDRTEVDFGSFPNNSVNTGTNSPPWTRGNPNGVNSADPQIIEDCTQMVESRQGGWNDFPCNWRISGVICKRKCTSYCAAQDADIFCRARCAEVVSIHSQQEQDFVTKIAGPLLTKCQFTDACSERMEHTNKSAANFDRMLRGFWIGMNRVYGTLLNHNTIDTNVTCIWSDRSKCDYGSVQDGSVTPDTVIPPWARGNPNGANPGGDPLIVQACVQMVEGRHGGWNDISCTYRLGGLICKRKCSSYCAAQDV